MANTTTDAVTALQMLTRRLANVDGLGPVAHDMVAEQATALIAELQIDEPPRLICSKVLHCVELILERSNVADLRHAITRLPDQAVITEIMDLGEATGITFGQTFYQVDEEEPF